MIKWYFFLAASIMTAIASIMVTACRAQTYPGVEAPPLKYLVGTGEYQCFIIQTATGKLYGIGSNPRLLGTGDREGQPGLPTPVVLPEGLSIKVVASGLHNSVAVDEHGEVWTWGDNGQGQAGDGTQVDPPGNMPHKITQDSLGRPFDKVIQVCCWWSSNVSEGTLALKSDGSVWIWGNTAGGFRGDEQVGQINTRPVQVHIPGHRAIKKIVAAETVIALAGDGTVWTWGGNGRRFLLGNDPANPAEIPNFRIPRQVLLPQKIKDIAGGGYINYALGVNGKLYGWGYAGSYMGIGTGGYAANTPIAQPRDLTSDLDLPLPVRSVTTNSVATHVILTDSSLWGWGDNATGCVGNGQELDFAIHQPPYSWDWGVAQMLVQKPVHIAPEIHDFIRVFESSAAVFYSYAETGRGQLYSWGRNKGSVLGNGVVAPSSEIVAVYPNSWDIPSVTPVDPFDLKKPVLSTSPYCLAHPDTHPCNEFKIPYNQPPIANAGIKKEITLPVNSLTLDGSTSKDEDGKIMYYQWSQISGPANARILSPHNTATRIAGLRAGKYIFQLKVTDNGWAASSATVEVIVKDRPDPLH